MAVYQVLTDRDIASSTAITPTTLIHIVTTGDTSQGNPAGSSYKAELQQLSSIFSGGTLDQTLVLGNTTGTNNIIIEDGQSLRSTNNNSNIIFIGSGITINVIDSGSTYNSNITSSLTNTTISGVTSGDYSTVDTSDSNVTSSLISITNDRDVYHSVDVTQISTLVNETSTGFYSSTVQTNHQIESYVEDADFLLTETKNAYEYFTKVDNQTLDVNTTFTQVEDNIEMSITDNGWSTFIQNTLSGLSNGSKQQKLQISPNPSVFVTEDRRGGWMQTSDDTTTLMIYCDMDPATTDTSIVQIKAHVRGISSDKMLGYAAEITSWVRVNPAEPYPVTQIGVVDYTIKSEFTTASSSFVISGPNMYIDVTGEIGITIDWTCNVELLYDKNTF